MKSAVEGMIDGEPAIVDADRVGVRLLPKGILPAITLLPDSFDERDKERSLDALRSNFGKQSGTPLEYQWAGGTPASRLSREW